MPRFRTRAIAAAAALALSTAGLLAAAVPASADPLVPTDAALLKCVNAKVGLAATNTTFTQAQLDSIVTLYCNDAGVHSLEGIDALSQLKELYLYNSATTANDFTDLTPLSGLPNLSKLNLAAVPIDTTTLGALTGNAALRYLNLHTIPGGFADLTPLSGLTQIDSLFLMGNGISDITPLAPLVNLISLDINGNQVTDLSPMAGMTNLQLAQLTNNPGLADISVLANMPKLVNLYIAASEVSDLSPLAGLSLLWKIWISNSKVTDLTPLVTTRASNLVLNGNDITDVSPLAQMPLLARSTSKLNLDENHIVDVSPLAAIGAAGAGVSALGQTVSLDDAVVGEPSANPVVQIDGSPAAVTVDGAEFDAAANAWTFAAAGSATGSWANSVGFPFTGTFTQAAADAVVEPEVPVEPEVTTPDRSENMDSKLVSPTAPQAPVKPATAGNALASTGTAVAPMFVGAVTILAGGIASLIAVGFLRRRTEGADTSS